MIAMNKALHALMAGDLSLEADGTYQILYVDSGWTPDASDTGHEFEADITTAGGTILLRETLSGVTLTDRVFDAADIDPLSDPGGGTTAAHIALVKTANGAGGSGGGGAPATNRIVAHEDIADLTFDGVNDKHTWAAGGLLKLGA